MTKLMTRIAHCSRRNTSHWGSMMSRFAVVLLLFTALPRLAAAGPLTWSVTYDQTSSVTNGMRSVALSQQSGNDSIYIGFIQTSGNRNALRLDTNSPYSQLNSRNPQDGGDQPKAITTDDRGNVYIGDRVSGGTSAIINTHNAALDELSSVSVVSDQFGGLDSWNSGGSYYLYASRETSGEIRRYNVDTATAPTLDTTFGTSGVFTIPSGGTLRGIEVAADGTIYVANRDLGKVFKVSPDLSTISEASITRAMDVALFGGNLYVTSYNGTNSLIRVLDAGTLLPAADDITVADTGFSRGSSEGWAGIDIGSDGRIWLTDHYYQTSGTAKDRLLVSSPVPEPASIVLALLGGIALLVTAARYRKR